MVKEGDKEGGIMVEVISTACMEREALVVCMAETLEDSV